MKNLKIVAFALTATLFLSSCSDDDDNPVVVEEEVITTVITTLVNGNQTVVLTSRDLDGDGPNEPVTTVNGTFRPNVLYTGAVRFLNETTTPAEEITEEIAELSKEHQVFFSAPAAVGTFAYTDADPDGKPIGLSFTLQTGNVGTGNLTVTLRHLLNKSASGVEAGNIANAGGSTDVEVTYPITIANEI